MHEKNTPGAWNRSFKHIALNELGLKKGESPPTNENIYKVYEKAIGILNLKPS